MAVISYEPWPWASKNRLNTRERIDEVDALIDGITKRRHPGWDVLVAHLRERREVLVGNLKPRAGVR